MRGTKFTEPLCFNETKTTERSADPMEHEHAREHGDVTAAADDRRFSRLQRRNEKDREPRHGLRDIERTRAF